MSALAAMLLLQITSVPTVEFPRDGAEADEPEVAAVDFLDAAPSTVHRPSDARGFMLQMPVILARSGPSAGFGLGAFPVRTFLWEREWNGSIPPLLRFLSGLNLSLAIVNAPRADVDAGADGRVHRLATAAGLQLFNDRDPLRNAALAACLDLRAGRMAGEYGMSRTDRRWGPVSRLRIDECLERPAMAMALTVGATSDYGQAGLAYEVASHGHAVTAAVEKRFAHRYEENPFGLGLRYTLEQAHISPTVESRLELLPPPPNSHEPTLARVMGGAGVTFGLPEGFALTLGLRATSPYLTREGDADYRGFVSIGWGGYDTVSEMFGRGLARQAPR